MNYLTINLANTPQRKTINQLIINLGHRRLPSRERVRARERVYMGKFVSG